MAFDDDKKLEEYRSLRTEMTDNRKFIFERPLVISSALVILFSTGYNANYICILAALTLFMLGFNLWFTFNRLNSNTRILGYFMVVHEGKGKASWIGWENALIKYRVFIGSKNPIIESILKKYDKIKEVDANRFYTPIYYFHLFIGIAVFSASSVMTLSRHYSEIYQKTIGSPFLWVMILNIIAVTIFIGWSLIKYYPNKFKNKIQIEKELWENIL